VSACWVMDQSLVSSCEGWGTGWRAPGRGRTGPRLAGAGPAVVAGSASSASAAPEAAWRPRWATGAARSARRSKTGAVRAQRHSSRAPPRRRPPGRVQPQTPVSWADSTAGTRRGDGCLHPHPERVHVRGLRQGL